MMDSAMEAALIAYNQVLLNQPEDERNQPLAMSAAITAYLAAKEAAGEVVLVELIMEADGQEPFVCAQEGVFPDEASARQWVVNTWPFHKDHGHVIEINPQQDDGSGASIFASFVTLPFGRGLSAARPREEEK